MPMIARAIPAADNAGPAAITTATRGATPIDAIRAMRDAGWDGAISVIDEASGSEVLRAAAGWDGSPVWS